MTKKRPERASAGRKTGDTSKPGNGHGAKSHAVRERAVLALLSERTLTDAADKAQVGERTLRRWMAEDAEFQAEYKAARDAVYQAGITRVQALTAKAVDALEDLLTLKDAPSARLGAARTIAEIGMHQHDSDYILRKLDTLESTFKQQQRGR